MADYDDDCRRCGGLDGDHLAGCAQGPAAPVVTDQMIEAKAIIFFYEDELGNLTDIAKADAAGNRRLGDKIGRDMDRWETHPEHVKDRFRHRAREAFEEGAINGQ